MCAMGLGLGLARGGRGDVSALYPLASAATLIADFAGNRYYQRTGAGVPFTPMDFATMFTFARGTLGTFYNSQGLLATAPTNGARLQYDPATLAPQGILIENAATNLAPFSNVFTDASWTKSDCSVSKTALGPAGTANEIFAIKEGSSNTFHAVYGSVAKAASTITYTASVYAGPGNGTRNAAVGIFSGAGVIGAVFNPATGAFLGTFQTGSSTGMTFVSSGSQKLPNGLYRFWATVTLASTVLAVGAYVGTASGTTPGYAGDGTSTIVAGNVQVEVGSFPTSYVDCPTSAPITRLADGCVHTTGSDFNANEGSMYVAGLTPPGVGPGPTGQRLIGFNPGNNQNIIVLARDPSNSRFAAEYVVASNVSQASIVTATNSWPDGVTCKAAAAYKANDFAVTVNGSMVATSGSGSLPGVSRLDIGGSVGAGNNWNSTIGLAMYYPARLSNAQLQALTA